MVNNLFEMYKVKREIDRIGVNIEFHRIGQNEFGEKTEDILMGAIKGLFHASYNDQRSMITFVENVKVDYKPKNGFLCLYEDVKGMDLKVDDYAVYNGKKYNVIGIVNVQEWNKIADVTLEDVDV